MNEITPGSDPEMEHTRVRYHRIGREGWYITTPAPAEGGGTGCATAGPFNLYELDTELLAIKGSADDRERSHGQLPVHAQVIEEALLAPIQAAAIETAEKINARGDKRRSSGRGEERDHNGNAPQTKERRQTAGRHRALDRETGRRRVVGRRAPAPARPPQGKQGQPQAEPPPVNPHGSETMPAWSWDALTPQLRSRRSTPDTTSTHDRHEFDAHLASLENRAARLRTTVLQRATHQRARNPPPTTAPAGRTSHPDPIIPARAEAAARAEHLRGRERRKGAKAGRKQNRRP